MQTAPRLFLLALALLLALPSRADNESEPYTLLWYKDVVERTKSLLQHPHLFKVVDIYDLYPELVSIQCGHEKCISPYIEMTNFENGEDYIRRLPTVLIVAGIHGNEVVGTNAIYRLFDIILKHKATDETWFSILNNLRIIFLPMVNPSGFFYKRREESQIIGGNERLLDPNRDFNWDKPEGCFETLAGQMINHVFKDNLIVGSLTYHGGDNSLSYPWGTYVHLKHSNSPDQTAFRHVVGMLKHAAGENKGLNVPMYNSGTMEKVVYDVNGGYEDWAYGGSFEKKYLTMACLPEKSPFAREFLESDDTSNRAFIYLVEAGLDKTPHEGTLGNQLSVLDKSASGAVIGNISRNVTLMKQFFEVMRPFPFVHSIKAVPASGDQTQLEVVLDVKGCQKVDSVELTSPPVVSQSAQIDKPSFATNTQSNPVVLTALVDAADPSWQAEAEVHLRIVCDAEWLEQNKKFGDPQSHFFRAKSDPGYTASRKGFSFGALNLDDVAIHGVDLARLDKAVAFHKNFDEIELVYDDHMMVKLGDRYPLELSYNIVTHEALVSVTEVDANMSISVTKQAADEDDKPGHSEDRALLGLADLLRKSTGSVLLSVYESNPLLQVDTDPAYVLPQFRKYYEQPSSYRKLVLSQEQLSQTALDVQLRLNRPVKLSPTEYMNLLGKRVIVNFGDKDDQQNVSGLIVWKSHALAVKEAKMGQSLPLPESQRSHQKPSQPADEAKADESHDGGMLVPASGLTCGSANPATLVRPVEDGSTFQVFLTTSPNKTVRVKLSTSRADLADPVFVFGSRSNQRVSLSSTAGQSEFATFTGVLEKAHRGMLGRTVRVETGAPGETVLECFLEKSNAEVAQTVQALVAETNHKHNQTSAEGPSEPYEEETKEPVNYTRIYIIFGLFLGVGLILCLCSFCGKKIREAGQVEMRELHPRPNAEINEWDN